MRLYIIGPITGRENLNEPRFRKAKEILEKCGYQVIIPHDVVKIPKTKDAEKLWQVCMRQSIRAMLTCHGVAHLDCEQSRGSAIEFALGMDVGMAMGRVSDWVRRARSVSEYAEQAG